MTDFRDFKGAARPIDDVDIPRLAYRLGVGEDEMHAVMDVEAAGGAWDKQGRPKMLFEPHRFYKNLGPGAERDRAVVAGLAYPSWGEKPYPADSYPRLIRAMAIDETAALKSASWGMGQILGENFAMLGYASPQAMVLAFLDDAETHLEGMVAFILAAKLDDELRSHNWAAFARGYNGPQYAKHNYHGRLAARFGWWQGKADTAWSPAAQSDPTILPETAPVPTPAPTVPAKPLTPIEQMNKPIQGAKTGAASAGLGSVLLIIWASSGYMPAPLQTPEAMAALGALFAAVPGLIGSFIAAYRARDLRFMPKKLEA